MASTVPDTQARATLAVLAASLAPFFFLMPPWVAGAGLLGVIWRYRLLSLQRPAPRPLGRALLAFAALGGVIVTFRGFGGAAAGGALLVLTSGLKALESRSRRDYHILTLLVVFLIAAALLLNQSLPLAIYESLVLWAAVAVRLGGGADPGRRSLARRAATLIATALPVAAVLFLLFPRLPGPLFRFGSPRRAAVSGLSTHMNPGSISRLAVSEQIAFRVRFFGAVPPRGERYFRGPVLQHYNGREWTRGQTGGRTTFAVLGKPVHYRVRERANGARWLFLLALAVKVDTPSRITANFEALAPRPLWHDLSFTATSYPRYRAGISLSATRRAENLALPRGIDPRARALAERWRLGSASARDVVRKALAYFHREPFYYTLTPPRLRGRNRVDQFLFRTRRGFCEHYASAFAVLMRAAGIPARVVTGYAGGTINPYDGRLVVRQANAHAWDEVWLARRGWVRVDPTGAIPPSRVESSARFAAATGAGGETLLPPGGFTWRLRNIWDAADTFWNQYIAGYGPGLQHHLLTRLGLDKAAPGVVAGLMVAGISAASLLVFLLGRRRRPRPRRDPAQQIYRRWNRRLARRGIQHRASEAPLNFLARIAREHPRLYAEAERVIPLYLQARYAGDPKALAELKRYLDLFGRAH